MKTVIELQFCYCPLVWMFHSRTLNNSINHLHECVFSSSLYKLWFFIKIIYLKWISWSSDFSTLYTYTPHDEFLNIFNELIIFFFKGGDAKFIFFNGHGAKWSKDFRSVVVVFNKTTFKKNLQIGYSGNLLKF